MTLEELEHLFTHHAVETGKTTGMNTAGKNFGSVINKNLLPLENIFRYVPPVLHVIMGLGNNTFRDLKTDVVGLDMKESNRDDILVDLTEELKALYDKKDQLEVKFSDTQLAHMISINDYSRVKLLKEGREDEAAKKAQENYEQNSNTKRHKNVKNNCDNDLCIIFQCDEESDWDEEFVCHNKCRKNFGKRMSSQ